MKILSTRSKPAASSIASSATKFHRSSGTKSAAAFPPDASRPSPSVSSSSANRKSVLSSPKNIGRCMPSSPQANRRPLKPSSSSTTAKTSKFPTKPKHNASSQPSSTPSGKSPASPKKKSAALLRLPSPLRSSSKPATIACVSPPSAP